MHSSDDGLCLDDFRERAVRKQPKQSVNDVCDGIEGRLPRCRDASISRAPVASLIGATCVALDRMFAFGFQGWDVALSFSVLYFAAGYCIWLLDRSITG